MQKIKRYVVFFLLVIAQGLSAGNVLQGMMGADIDPERKVLRQIATSLINDSTKSLSREPDPRIAESELGSIRMFEGDTYGDVFHGLVNSSLIERLARHSQCNDLLQKILEQGGNADKDPYFYGNTPLDTACQAQNIKGVKLLLQHGAHAMAGCDGKIPLDNALWNMNNEIIRELAPHTNLNARTNYLGSSALHALVRNFYVKRNPGDMLPSTNLPRVELLRNIKTLLRNGAYFAIHNRQGRNVIEYANECAQKDQALEGVGNYIIQAHGDNIELITNLLSRSKALGLPESVARKIALYVFESVDR